MSHVYEEGAPKECPLPVFVAKSAVAAGSDICFIYRLFGMSILVVCTQWCTVYACVQCA